MESPVPVENSKFFFSVHPSVMFKLGEDLITDDIQALTELIKNAYDADSKSVDVHIDTTVWTEAYSGEEVSAARAGEINRKRVHLLEQRRALAERHDAGSTGKKASDEAAERLDTLNRELARLPSLLQGKLDIVDGGTGMSLEEIERGWLTVSASKKREMKARGETTAQFNRTPLGDKGLGRLGAQRLGRALDIRTRQNKGQPTHYATVVWEDFANVNSLANVPVNVKSRMDDAMPGTRVSIRGLASHGSWNDKTRSLGERLVELISPFDNEMGLRIRLFVDGDAIDLRDDAARLLNRSGVRYDICYENGVLAITGQMSIENLRPPSGDEKIRHFNELVASDNGHAFLKYLLATEKRRAAALHLEHGTKDRFCRFEVNIPIDSVPSAVRVPSPDGHGLVVADPGPFVARIDGILRTRSAKREYLGTNFESWLNALVGIRVYRNGFGIRLDDDWLGLAAQWNAGPSYYSLRPTNTVGYVNLTASGNAAIEETSNREDLRDTPAFRNFKLLFDQWMKQSQAFQNLLGRGYLAYVKEHAPRASGMKPGFSLEELDAVIETEDKHANDVATALANAEATAAAAATALNIVEAAHVKTSSRAAPTAADDTKFEDALTAGHEALATLTRELQIVTALESRQSERRHLLEVVAERLEEAERQLQDVWEVVSLGVTAEAIAHEVKNLTARLTTRSKQAAKYNDAKLRDTTIGEYIEHVRSSSKSMAQQVSHLDSSLRHVRDRRDDVRLSEAARTAAEFFNEHWKDDGIRVNVRTTADFTARTSRGKLAQVFDNLLLNSGYWVGEALSAQSITEGHVTIEIDAPYVLVYDNGPGVDPTVEEMLFDPFVSRKPGREGRGLGLFVARRLLSSEALTISLDLERNARGNRFRFRVDFATQLEAQE